MMSKNHKILQAKCVTSSYIERKDITFDSKTGLIVSVLAASKSPSEVDFYYNDDILLFAGMGDIHIHAREDVTGKNNYKEDFCSTCLAAFNGGLVHVADMPNNPVAPIDDQSYLEKFKLAGKTRLPILMYAGIGPNTFPLSFKVPYKVYMGPSIGELFFKTNADLKVAMPKYKNSWVSFHCEDPEILEKSKNLGDHFKKRPIEAELMATELAIELIREHNLKGKLCHYSAGKGLELIRLAKRDGLNITCEVTPQHLFLSEELILEKPANEQILYQMNPPIRSSSDAQMLLDGLRNGDIDYLATDHAPHSKEEKEKGMSGMPGLDSYASFVTWLLVNQKFDPKIIARVCSENPGQFFNEFLPGLNQQSSQFHHFGKGLGYLQPSFSASFTLLNLAKPKILDQKFFKSKTHWSPFLGYEFPGSLEALFLNGKQITE